MINLVYSADKNYFKYVFMSILSVLKTTKESLNINILSMNIKTTKREFKIISKEQIEFLNNFVKTYNINNKVTLFNLESIFDDYFKNGGANINSVYSPYAFLRLFLDRLDNINCSKILYLDSDILALDDINKLYSMDVSNYEFIGTQDRVGHFFFGKNYCNTGVLLLNLEKIRETKLFEKALNYVFKIKSFMPDQDAINYNAKFRKVLYNPRFNEQGPKIKKDTIIKHFCKVLHFLPVPHTVNIKQDDFENIHKKLKIFAFDNLFEEYKKIIDKYPNLF